MPFDTGPDWPKELQAAVTAYRAEWRAKMDEVNACIAANADQEELVDQPEVTQAFFPDRSAWGKPARRSAAWSMKRPSSGSSDVVAQGKKLKPRKRG